MNDRLGKEKNMKETFKTIQRALNLGINSLIHTDNQLSFNF